MVDFSKLHVSDKGYLAAAINAPVTVMKTAGEGGPWGMALWLHICCRNRKQKLWKIFG